MISMVSVPGRYEVVLGLWSAVDPRYSDPLLDVLVLHTQVGAPDGDQDAPLHWPGQGLDLITTHHNKKILFKTQTIQMTNQPTFGAGDRTHNLEFA